ncbi:EamA family transporter, partial [Alphaproteobacteria bacterium]|nr:EamA family transporter [Alphaproteobacteria bacterium]
PFALIVFYFLVKNGFNDFQLSDPSLLFLIFLAGPMTVIPLFLYIRGVELIGLGTSGMIFYVTPTLQFLLGFFIYNEDFSLVKLISFIFIWFAIVIYMKDLYETDNYVN